MTKGKSKVSSQEDDADDTPDGGWGWMVVAGYVLAGATLIPIVQNFGLIYMDRLHNLGLTSTDITLIISLNSSVGQIFGIFQGFILKKFGYRTVALFGITAFTIGTFLTGLAQSLTHFIITHGIVTSIGFTYSVNSFSLAFNTYFRKKRSIAQGILMGCQGLGPVIMPLLVSWTLSQYGVQWTAFILAALNSNGYVGALLLQPVAWHRRKKYDSPQELSDIKKNGTTRSALPKQKSTDIFPKDCKKGEKSIRTDDGSPLLVSHDPTTGMLLPDLKKGEKSIRTDDGSPLLVSHDPTTGMLLPDFRKGEKSIRTDDGSPLLVSHDPTTDMLLPDFRKGEKSIRTDDGSPLLASHDPTIGMLLPDLKKEINNIGTTESSDSIVEDTDSVGSNYRRYSPISLKKIRKISETEDIFRKDTLHPVQEHEEDASSELSFYTALDFFPSSPQGHRKRCISACENRDNSFNFSCEDSKPLHSTIKFNSVGDLDRRASTSSMLSKLHYSLYDFHQPNVDEFNDEEPEDSDSSSDVPEIWIKRLGHVIVQTFDLDLLKDLTYVIITIGLSVAVIGELIFSLLTPFIMQEVGLDKQQTATFMAIIAATDIIARFTSPIIAAKVLHIRSCQLMYLLALSLLIVTRTCLLIVTAFELFLAVAVGIGLAKGIRTVFWVQVLPDYVHITKLGSAMAIQNLTNGILIFFAGPMGGKLVEVTGSYLTIVYFANVLSAATIILWVVSFTIKRIRAHKGHKKTSPENSTLT